MNKDQLKGQWSEVKGKVKERWGKLTDDELTQINGQYDQLIGKIQQRYGCRKEQAEEQFKSFEFETVGATSSRQENTREHGRNQSGRNEPNRTPATGRTEGHNDQNRGTEGRREGKNKK